MRKEDIEILFNAHRNCGERLNRSAVVGWFEDLLALIVPEYKVHPIRDEQELENRLMDSKRRLHSFLMLNGIAERENLCTEFYSKLLYLQEVVNLDAEAICAGDPAARSVEEVRHAYLSFYAICTHRIAHELYILGIRIIPRILAEHAHGKTGIDIHPAAKIGKRLCIDHGTGVVIGETAEIGENVKIYQGVTLGALSVTKEVSGTKRHPTVGDNVVIYAGATILGGDTIIGDNSIIGGNVWLVESVEPGSKIYYRTTELK